MKAKRKNSGPRALAALLPKAAGPAMRRRGFAEATILAEWQTVVGEVIGRESIPLRLVHNRDRNDAANLHIRVSGAFAPEVQHLEPQIVERINAYFGYRAVERLTLHQGPVPRQVRRKRRNRSLSATERADLDRSLEGVDDPDLRDSLSRLGSAILTGRSR